MVQRVEQCPCVRVFMCTRERERQKNTATFRVVNINASTLLHTENGPEREKNYLCVCVCTCVVCVAIMEYTRTHRAEDAESSKRVIVSCRWVPAHCLNRVFIFFCSSSSFIVRVFFLACLACFCSQSMYDLARSGWLAVFDMLRWRRANRRRKNAKETSGNKYERAKLAAEARLRRIYYSVYRKAVKINDHESRSSRTVCPYITFLVV